MEKGEVQYPKSMLYSHIGLASSAVFNFSTVLFNVIGIYRKQRWFIGPDSAFESTATAEVGQCGIVDKLDPKNKIVMLNLAALILISISSVPLILLAGFIYYDKLVEKLFKISLWTNLACLIGTLGITSAIQYCYGSSNTVYTFKNHAPATGKISEPNFVYSNNIFLMIFSISGIFSTAFLLYKLMKAPRIILTD